MPLLEDSHVNDFFTRLYVQLLRQERGQTMAEYVVVLGIISITILVALGALSGAIGGQLGRVTSDI
jgi:Flp pilus assembly pilin Flp